MYPDYGPAVTEVLQHAMEQEAAYEKAGKNRLDYYTGGGFAKDAKAVGQKFSLIKVQAASQSVFANAKPGVPFDLNGAKVIWNGKDPTLKDSAGNYINLDLAP